MKYIAIILIFALNAHGVELKELNNYIKEYLPLDAITASASYSLYDKVAITGVYLNRAAFDSDDKNVKVKLLEMELIKRISYSKYVMKQFKDGKYNPPKGKEIIQDEYIKLVEKWKADLIKISGIEFDKHVDFDGGMIEKIDDKYLK